MYFIKIQNNNTAFSFVHRMGVASNYLPHSNVFMSTDTSNIIIIQYAEIILKREFLKCLFYWNELL